MGDVVDEVWTYVETDQGIGEATRGRRDQFNDEFQTLRNVAVARRHARNRQQEGRRRILESVSPDFLDTLVPALTNNSTGVLDALRNVVHRGGLDPLTAIQRANTIRLHRLARVGGFAQGYARTNPLIESGDISLVTEYQHGGGNPNWQPRIDDAIRQHRLVRLAAGLYTIPTQAPVSIARALTNNGRPWDPNAPPASLPAAEPLGTPQNRSPATPRVQTIQTIQATGSGSRAPSPASPLAGVSNVVLPSIEGSDRPVLRPNAGLPEGAYREPPAPRPQRPGPQPAGLAQYREDVMAGRRRERASSTPASPGPGPQPQGRPASPASRVGSPGPGPSSRGRPASPASRVGTPPPGPSGPRPSTPLGQSISDVAAGKRRELTPDPRAAARQDGRPSQVEDLIDLIGHLRMDTTRLAASPQGSQRPQAAPSPLPANATAEQRLLWRLAHEQTRAIATNTAPRMSDDDRRQLLSPNTLRTFSRDTHNIVNGLQQMIPTPTNATLTAYIQGMQNITNIVRAAQVEQGQPDDVRRTIRTILTLYRGAPIWVGQPDENWASQGVNVVEADLTTLLVDQLNPGWLSGSMISALLIIMIYTRFQAAAITRAAGPDYFMLYSDQYTVF